MKILFFAWLKEEIDKESYNLEIESQVTIKNLKNIFINKLGYKVEILNRSNININAVNLNFENSVIIQTQDLSYQEKIFKTIKYKC